jgi:hypothetical protein
VSPPAALGIPNQYSCIIYEGADELIERRAFGLRAILITPFYGGSHQQSRISEF